MSKLPATIAASAIAGAVLAIAAPGALAQAPSRGQEAYRLACAQCHGENGTGDGILRRFLTVVPSDLTTLRQRSPDGQFPFYRVFLTVDGRTSVPAHGTREMPAWGSIFAIEAGDRFGPFGAETYIRGRVVELVEHVQSLQK